MSQAGWRFRRAAGITPAPEQAPHSFPNKSEHLRDDREMPKCLKAECGTDKLMFIGQVPSQDVVVEKNAAQMP
jgi:hypothetical protein